MHQPEKNNQSVFLHEELTYKLRGACFRIVKELGSHHKESIYQRALQEELFLQKIPFRREASIDIYYPVTGKKIGIYRPDFLIDDKIIVELKAQPVLPGRAITQLYDYLKNSHYELGFLINFGDPRLFIARRIYTNDRKPYLKISASNQC